MHGKFFINHLDKTVHVEDPRNIPVHHSKIREQPKPSDQKEKMIANFVNIVKNDSKVVFKLGPIIF